MNTRIEKVESFIVTGFEMKGDVSQIPALWDKLNGALCESGASKSEESYGITLAMENGNFHYIAGVRKEFAEGMADSKEVVVPSGNFIVAKVDGGLDQIPAVFGALMQMPGINLRHSYGFEKYLHPEGSEGYETEVWVAIE